LIRLRCKSVIIFANYGFDHYFLRVNNQNPACLPASSTRCQNQSAPVKQAIFAKELVQNYINYASFQGFCIFIQI